MPFRIGRTLQISLFALGFTSLFTQVYLLREFMTVLYGNELIMAIVLSCWMMLTGIGAFLGSFFRRGKEQFSLLHFLQFIFSILPLLTVLKLGLWKACSVPFGSMVSLTTTLYVSFLLLTPFCMLNGFLFVACASSLSDATGKGSYGKSYALESFGSLAAGILVNFVCLWLFDNWTSLRILLAVNMSVFLFFVWTSSRKVLKILLTPVALLVMILPFFTGLKDFSDRNLFPNQEVLRSEETPYGKVVVTLSSGQMNYYENGLLLFSGGNEIFNEEAVHYAMVQRPDPKNVLLISGGISGTLKEILKYDPAVIDYLEMNPAIIKTGMAFSGINKDRRIRVIQADARRFLRENHQMYDVALICLPEPSTLQINRFYTLEFFRELKARLNPGAVVSMSLPSTSDYVSGDAARLNSSIFRTLNSVFRNILIIPGQKNYFISSDAPLHPDIAQLISKRGIASQYVNAWYIDDDLLKDRSMFILSQLSKTEMINTDLKPAGFFLQIRYWTSFFTNNYFICGIILLLLILLLGLTLNPVSFGLFTGGFTSASVEIILIIVFQVTYGYVFQTIGVIVTLFMAGLATGSLVQSRLIGKSSYGSYLRLQGALAGYCYLLPFIFLAVNSHLLPDSVNFLVMGILTLVVSFLTGMEFSSSTQLRSGKREGQPARNYAADLFGSATGIVVSAVILVPLAGIAQTCMLLSILNIFSAAILFLHRKKIVSL